MTHVVSIVMKTANSAINATVNGKQARWYHSNYQPGKELYVKYTFPAMKGTTVSNVPVAISSATDLLKMRDNPAGSYYLTKDITVPQNTQIFNDFSSGAEFTGTFDGKGHKIMGYTVNATEPKYKRFSLFGYTKNATFKNLVWCQYQGQRRQGCPSVRPRQRQCQMQQGHHHWKYLCERQ